MTVEPEFTDGTYESFRLWSHAIEAQDFGYAAALETAHDTVTAAAAAGTGDPYLGLAERDPEAFGDYCRVHGMDPDDVVVRHEEAAKDTDSASTATQRRIPGRFTGIMYATTGDPHDLNLGGYDF